MTWLLDTLVWTGALIALVLVLRRPVARQFGPRTAYALWILPLLRLILPPLVLPAPAVETVPAASVAASGGPVEVSIEYVASAPADRLTRTAYNVRAFNPSAEEVRDMVLRAFPQAIITWDTDMKRQSIVDSWPADVDDSAARADWGFAPRYDFEAAFREYLIPGIRERYAATS